MSESNEANYRQTVAYVMPPPFSNSENRIHDLNKNNNTKLRIDNELVHSNTHELDNNKKFSINCQNNPNTNSNSKIPHNIDNNNTNLPKNDPKSQKPTNITLKEGNGILTLNFADMGDEDDEE